MTRQYIWTLVIVLLTTNVVIFIFLLIKKIIMKITRNKKEKIRNRFEADFLRFITQQDSQLSIIPKTKLEKKILQSLILDYNSFISGATQIALLENAGKDSIVNKVKKYLKSNNIWKKKIGTYLAGEYEIKEVSTFLLDQLKISDNELLYVTARSLIKITNELYLREIFYEAAKPKRMSKKNGLSLLELVEGNIVDILEEFMTSEVVFLQIIAIEELGKRQYQESIKWIEKLISQPQKEMRIAALKASYMLGHIDEDNYLATVLSLKNDSEWEVRAFLAKFLKKVKCDGSIKILTELMSDNNWYVRHNAAESLLTHDEKGKIALLNLLGADDPFARDAANTILERKAFY